MLQFFRSIIKSRFGALFGVVFLATIALAFVAGDLLGTNSLGGATSGKLAEVGDETVTAADLNREANEALQRVRQRDPQMSMQAFVAQNGLEIVLDDLIDLAAMSSFGNDIGVVAGTRLVDSELQRAGVTQLKGISRESVAQRIIARQLLAPAEYGATIPQDLALRYAQLLGERRTGSVFVMPALAFAPEKEPTGAELAAFYKANTSRFIRPERRTLRYALFGPEVVKNVPAPTDAEIAERYNASKDQYAPLERRRITQLVVPTEAAANAIIAEINGGRTLQAAASQKGLSAATLDPLSKTDLAAQSSKAIADAVFATPVGQIAPPMRSPLGWYIVKVEAQDNRAGKTLEQAKGEIGTALAAEKQRAALNDFLAKAEEQFEGGASLSEVAKSLGLELKSTPPVTADGRIYGKVGETIDPALRPVLETAFAMQEEDPQVGETEPGKSFVVYEVVDVAASAPAPLNEITDDVKVAYALEKGAQAAKAQALKIQAAVRKGQKLDAVVAGLGKKLPPVEKVGMTRADLGRIQQSGSQVPPPIRLMFAMAQGSVKVQEAPQGRGWFVVVLDKVEPAKLTTKDPLVTMTRNDLGKVAGNEYAEALRKAISREVRVERNQAAIKAFRDELAGNVGE